MQVKISPESCSDSIPEEMYKAACVYTSEEAKMSCQTVGYPAMIKASWGGGGKGIRKVCDHSPGVTLLHSLGVTLLLKMAEALAMFFWYC